MSTWNKILNQKKQTTTVKSEKHSKQTNNFYVFKNILNKEFALLGLLRNFIEISIILYNAEDFSECPLRPAPGKGSTVELMEEKELGQDKTHDL